MKLARIPQESNKRWEGVRCDRRVGRGLVGVAGHKAGRREDKGEKQQEQTFTGKMPSRNLLLNKK